MINRCILCNGLIRGGKCTECGMPDQSKQYDLNENMTRKEKHQAYESTVNQSTTTYSENKKRNQSYNTGIPKQIPRDLDEGIQQVEDLFRHVGVDLSGDRKKQKNTNTGYNTTGNNKKNKTKNPRSIIKIIVTVFLIFQVVIPIIIGSLGVVFEAIGDAVSSVDTEIIPEWDDLDLDTMTELSPLEKAEEDMWYSYNYGEETELRVLPETGSEVDEILEFGIFEVGVHIPEGTYTMTCLTPAYLRMDDYENNRDMSEYLNDESKGVTSTEIDLYNGTIITINDGRMQFISSNGNEDTMYGVENENTNTVAVDGIMTVGEDIEPGFYDIHIAENDYGFVMISNPYEELPLDEEGLLDTYNYDVEYLDRFYLHYSEWDIEDDTVVDCEKHVYLPEGSQIGEDSMNASITLIPSKMIPPESSMANWSELYRY